MSDSGGDVKGGGPRPSLDELILDRLDMFRAAYLNLVSELEHVHTARDDDGDLDAADPVTGLTPLMFAARNNAVQAAQWLVEHGAAVNQSGLGGKTALMHAVQCSAIQVLEVLILNKADVNAKDDDGLTAFMYAAASGNMKVIDILANAGAKIDPTTDKSKSNALMIAVIATQTAVVDLMTIRLGEPVCSADVRGRTALHYAVCLQSTGMIERLVCLGADCNLPDKQGKTPVDLATDEIRKSMSWV